MGKYRTYKNGIHGLRYNGYYIVPEGERRKKTGFHVVDDNGKIIYEGQSCLDDCKWLIDIGKATEEEKRLIERLYKLDILKLQILLSQLIERKNQRPLNSKELMLEKWLDSVRGRKIRNLDLTGFEQQ